MKLKSLFLICVILLSVYFQVSVSTPAGTSGSKATTKRNPAQTTPKPTTIPQKTSTTRKTPVTSTQASDAPKNNRKMNFTAIGLRAFYVISALCGVIVIYFGVRYVCSERRRSKTRRYGRLRNGQDMEMRRLSEAEDDDDDDLTLFDASQRKGKPRR